MGFCCEMRTSDGRARTGHGVVGSEIRLRKPFLSAYDHGHANGLHPDEADAVFGLDIEIDEARRHQGLGRAAIEEAEKILRAAGVKRVELTVLGFNDHARHLYESLGFTLISAQMGKDLD